MLQACCSFLVRSLLAVGTDAMLNDAFPPVVSSEETLERQLEALLEWMQGVPDANGKGRHTAFFDALRAVLMDADALGPNGSSVCDQVLLSGFDDLEQQAPAQEQLVQSLLQQLAAHGDLQGPRADRLRMSLNHLLSAHARLFWQELQWTDQDAEPVQTLPADVLPPIVHSGMAKGQRPEEHRAWEPSVQQARQVH